MLLPNKKKYNNGSIRPSYFFVRTFNIRGRFYERGDAYDPYAYTYDELIWRLREGIILPDNMKQTTYDLSDHIEVDVTYSIQKYQLDPTGPEQVGKEPEVDIVVIEQITDIRVNLNFIEGDDITLPVDYENVDYQKRIIAYIEKQMTEDVIDYKDDDGW